VQGHQRHGGLRSKVPKPPWPPPLPVDKHVRGAYPPEAHAFRVVWGVVHTQPRGRGAAGPPADPRHSFSALGEQLREVNDAGAELAATNSVIELAIAAGIDDGDDV